MAIVRMKRLRVMALAHRREELLGGLLHLGCVEISEPDLSDPGWSALLRRETSALTETRTEIADGKAALEALKRYTKVKDGLFIQRRQVTEQEFLDPRRRAEAQAVCRKIVDSLREISRLQGEEGRLSARRAALVPWASLDLPLEQTGTEHVLFRLGVCPGATDTGTVRTALADAAAELYEVFADKQQKYYLLLCHRAEEENVQELLRPFNFSAVAFQGVTGTAAENLDALDRQLAENRQAQEAAAAVIAGEAGSRDMLRLYLDQLTTEAGKNSNAERLLTDGTILFFEGWAPAENLEAVESLLTRLDCAWDAEDPTEEEIPDVPVQLKNNWFTKPLNMVTEMYSLPSYGNVDPNPLMAPFFIFFYGFMMADMGYGLLMFLAGFLITRKYRPKGTMGNLFRLMTLCGVSTFIMGAITGGFFGDFLTQAVLLTTGRDFALPALFTPLDDTLAILVGSMALGLVHIITGMAVSVIRKLKRGAVLDALFQEITWWIVFLGVGLMALGVPNLVLYLGAALVVIGPLVTGKGVGKITGIFSSLYNNVTGYFGDILSYSRLMALMLAGSVIAQVFNTLGAIPGNIVIFVIISMAGNALNFALNLLGCYVHDLRLQCLEFFKTFYEDGGKPFHPLAVETKYVDVTEN